LEKYVSLKITFTTTNYYKDLVPEPLPAYKKFPEWFSNLPKNNSSKCPFTAVQNNILNLQYAKSNSMANCIGIQDFLKTGYIVPSWSSFIFREDYDGELYVNWMENPLNQSISSSGMDQFYGMKNPPIYNNFFKFSTPWIVQTQPGVSCLITNPIWHRNTSFTTSTGIFHTDKSPLSLPWFFEWNYKIKNKMNINDIDVENQVIDREEPIMLIIPFYRKTYRSEVKYVDEKEYDRLNKLQFHATHKFKSEDLYRKFRRKLGILFR